MDVSARDNDNEVLYLDVSRDHSPKTNFVERRCQIGGFSGVADHSELAQSDQQPTTRSTAVILVPQLDRPPWHY